MSEVQAHFRLLGLRVKDRVTGFSGVVSSLSFDLLRPAPLGRQSTSVYPPQGQASLKHGHTGLHDAARWRTAMSKTIDGVDEMRPSRTGRRREDSGYELRLTIDNRA